MSAPAWLMDAIHATKSEHVPTVPNPENLHWVQGNNPKNLINSGFATDVPTVPSVPKEIQSPAEKTEIVDIQREHRRAKVLDLIKGKRFAVLVEDDKTDPVIATIGIHNVAIFELAIPQHSYDGMVLLELIEKHYGENYANS